ncbi:neocarzinostatin apoprotein domain-containing protein [Corynebacterium sp. CCM 9203]|uniref:neocarzinostatin apoprotein domain-containing protein n=2 Tax=Corynebacterium TaxID=1716 RepID=UPI003523303E
MISDTCITDERHPMHKLFTTRTTALAAASLIFVAPLAACSNSETSETTDASEVSSSISEMSKSASAGLSEKSSEKSEPSSTSAKAASGSSDVEITVDNADGIKAGDTVAVEVSGLNPESGYYAAICAAKGPEGSPVPVCTGEMGDTESQAWLQNERGNAKISEDGTASFTLTASPSGDGVDCLTDECVLKVFGDHSEGFKDVAEVPVTFAS